MVMYGSVKQVEWADRIVAKHMPAIMAAREALRATMGKAKVAGAGADRLAAGDRAIAAFDETVFEGAAGWWIDNQDQLSVAIQERLPADDLARKMIGPAFTMAEKRLAA